MLVEDEWVASAEINLESGVQFACRGYTDITGGVKIATVALEVLKMMFVSDWEIFESNAIGSNGFKNVQGDVTSTQSKKTEIMTSCVLASVIVASIDFQAVI